MIDGLIIDLSGGVSPQSARFISNEAIFENYKYNRKASPEIPYKNWGLVFDNVETLEAMLQAEGN